MNLCAITIQVLPVTIFISSRFPSIPQWLCSARIFFRNRNKDSPVSGAHPLFQVGLLCGKSVDDAFCIGVAAHDLTVQVEAITTCVFDAGKIYRVELPVV